MSDLIKYLAIMIIGYLISRFNIVPEYMNKRIEKLQTIALYIMLGAMGYKIGTNKKILDNIYILGGKSFVIAFITIAFSVILVHIVYKKRGGKK